MTARLTIRYADGAATELVVEDGVLSVEYKGERAPLASSKEGAALVCDYIMQMAVLLPEIGGREG